MGMNKLLIVSLEFPHPGSQGGKLHEGIITHSRGAACAGFERMRSKRLDVWFL